MWILGVFIGFASSSLSVFIINELGFSIYNRKGLDEATVTYLGKDTRWDEIMVDDLFIVSYSYNDQEPRFYSKWFNNFNPGTYSVPISTAVASSSSAPFYFQPNTYTNGFNITETLIDGGLIANDPAYYAY